MRFFGSTFSEKSADAAFRRVLDGTLKAPSSNAVVTGADKVQSETSEYLAYRFAIENARHRIVHNQVYKLNLPVAVARFVWMISGNNRLADIAFYEPRVREFTDDGIIVPGSSYGTRVRQAHPGVDQLQGVVDRLKEDPNSRRAAISIYQPSDTVRTSKDIPCAFGMFFHIRDEKLHTQMIMRSNNATVLLPFNLFEFSMLAEVVAAECGVELGPLSHYAASMHVYETMRDFSDKIVDEGGECNSEPMQPMPQDPAPLEEVRRLVEFEARLRHTSEAINDGTLEEHIDRIRDEFSVFWQQLAFLLLAAVVNERCTKEGADQLATTMDPNLSKLVKWNKEVQGDPAQIPNELPLLDAMQRPDNIVTLHQTTTGASFKRRAMEHERSTGQPLSAGVLLDMEDRIISRLAARGLSEELSNEDFAAYLAEVSGTDA